MMENGKIISWSIFYDNEHDKMTPKSVTFILVPLKKNCRDETLEILVSGTIEWFHEQN